MIILAYIIMGHREWTGSEIRLFVAVTGSESSASLPQLDLLIDQGRIPISRKNVRRIPRREDSVSFEDLVTQFSEQADLVLMGFSLQKLTEEEGAFVKGFPGLTDVLFVRAGQRIVISEPKQ